MATSQKHAHAGERPHGVARTILALEGLPVVRSSSLKGWVSIMYGCNNF